MNTHIIGRNVEVTDFLKDFINKTIDDFKKFNLNVISTNVIVRKEKKEFNVEFIFNIKDNQTVVINEKDKDVYAGIDKASQKASKALRRLSKKIKSKKQNISIKSLEALTDDIQEESEPEIIQKTLKFQKPMTTEEALEQLKSSEDQFIVFNDKGGIMRTIYKRNDGKIGIY